MKISKNYYATICK